MIHIIFDGPPGPTAGRFVEVENDEGASVRVGEWRELDNGFWSLSIEGVDGLTAEEYEELYGQFGVGA